MNVPVFLLLQQVNRMSAKRGYGRSSGYSEEKKDKDEILNKDDFRFDLALIILMGWALCIWVIYLAVFK